MNLFLFLNDANKFTKMVKFIINKNLLYLAPLQIEIYNEIFP
jgi:hypothetical protein